MKKAYIEILLVLKTKRKTSTMLFLFICFGASYNFRQWAIDKRLKERKNFH